MKKERKLLIVALCLLAGFATLTALLFCVDVQSIAPEGTNIGFAALNSRFHALTGVHMGLYTLTDWLGLVPLLVCFCFGALGLRQWITRRSLRRVDADILLLGAYYLAIIALYFVFEMLPINYRPILIDGRLEASYPSSTTLLVLSVMPTLIFQLRRRGKHSFIRRAATVCAALFSLFMVLGRLISGVHWLTDIIGAVLLSIGVFLLYVYAVRRYDAKENMRGIS